MFGIFHNENSRKFFEKHHLWSMAKIANFDTLTLVFVIKYEKYFKKLVVVDEPPQCTTISHNDINLMYQSM